MAEYKILITDSAVKELEAIPDKDLKKIVLRIRSLAQNPRPQGSQKLSAQERYRIRMGDYRVVYSIEDKKSEVIIVKIGHRREIYR